MSNTLSGYEQAMVIMAIISIAILVGLWLYTRWERKKEEEAKKARKRAKRRATEAQTSPPSAEPQPELPELAALRMAAQESLRMNLRAEMAFQEMMESARRHC